MSEISAQISLYPLGQEDFATPIREVLRVLSEYELPHRMSSMSTVTWGDDKVVFAALREAFARVTERDLAVMTVSISNACPIPETPNDEGGEGVQR